MLKPLLTGWCSRPTLLRPFARHLGSGIWTSLLSFARHDQHNPVNQINLAKIWVFPKIGVSSPKSSILIGFAIMFTIHFGVPLFLETPISYFTNLDFPSRKLPVFRGPKRSCFWYDLPLGLPSAGSPTKKKVSQKSPGFRIPRDPIAHRN